MLFWTDRVDSMHIGMQGICSNFKDIAWRDAVLHFSSGVRPALGNQITPVKLYAFNSLKWTCS